ncbi:hypothetical protein DFJ74DRAFT_769977 [Hyaloraphidium curvatum]|nr:hypothetical protein DFJ74DRAFT_769977 [Hyaloraphidium curvatum]
MARGLIFPPARPALPFANPRLPQRPDFEASRAAIFRRRCRAAFPLFFQRLVLFAAVVTLALYAYNARETGEKPKPVPPEDDAWEFREVDVAGTGRDRGGPRRRVMDVSKGGGAKLSATDLALVGKEGSGTALSAFYAPMIRSLSENGPPSGDCFTKPARGKFDTVLVVSQSPVGCAAAVRLLNSLACYNVRGGNGNALMELVSDSARLQKHLEALLAVPTIDVPYNSIPPHDLASFNRFDAPALRTLAASSKTSQDLLRALAVAFLEHAPGVTSGFCPDLFAGGLKDFPRSLSLLDAWIRLFPRTLLVFLPEQGTRADHFREVASSVAAGERYGPRGSVVDLAGAEVEAVVVGLDEALGCGEKVGRMVDLAGGKLGAEECRRAMKGLAGT